MKNIHVLPTDKASRLYLHSNGKTQIRTELNRTVGYLGNNQHIYITSDEEIKEGDWVITYNGLLAKVITEITWHFMNSKKIILTTDQDLINDDIQPIPDDFIEWFVNNPKCEEVKVEKGGILYDYKYKIIIPKEAPKQQPTLEEITKQIQKECHQFVESVTSLTTNTSYQDATNTFLFMKLAELTLKLKNYESRNS